MTAAAIIAAIVLPMVVSAATGPDSQPTATMTMMVAAGPQYELPP
jgi:hypothetical protein